MSTKLSRRPNPVLFLLALLLLVVGFVRPVAARTTEEVSHAPNSDSVRKVVYHADFADVRRFSAMLTSINNMVTTYQNQLVDYDIRIVFVAWGIRFATADKLSATPFVETPALKARRADLLARLSDLHEQQGVKFEVCEITRNQIGLDKKKLIPGATMVDSGVVRLEELQHQGFAYIKIE